MWLSCDDHYREIHSNSIMPLPRDVEAALARYKRSLEDLTFNSKPLIDDLTRAAGQLEPKGDQIVEVIQSRIMQVASQRQNHMLSMDCILHIMFCTQQLALQIFFCNPFGLAVEPLFYAMNVSIDHENVSSCVMN